MYLFELGYDVAIQPSMNVSSNQGFESFVGMFGWLSCVFSPCCWKLVSSCVKYGTIAEQCRTKHYSAQYHTNCIANKYHASKWCHKDYVCNVTTGYYYVMLVTMTEDVLCHSFFWWDNKHVSQEGNFRYYILRIPMLQNILIKLGNSHFLRSVAWCYENATFPVGKLS